jgi:hypothetical protein
VRIPRQPDKAVIIRAVILGGVVASLCEATVAVEGSLPTPLSLQASKMFPDTKNATPLCCKRSFDSTRRFASEWPASAQDDNWTGMYTIERINSKPRRNA